jgi:hypothetical protein
MWELNRDSIPESQGDCQTAALRWGMAVGTTKESWGLLLRKEDTPAHYGCRPQTAPHR